MQTRRIGSLEVSAVGMGAMPLSVEGYHPEESQAVATLHAALDAGVTLVDTADAYHPRGQEGHNELLVAKALATHPRGSEVLVATKGGHVRSADGGWGLNGRPDHLKRACEASLTRLGVEAIGLYQFHRPDPEVPYADSVGALKELLDEGKIRMAGISNANPDQIRQAREILGDGLVSVQNQFSPAFRSSEPELELCTELGLAFLPWSPLGGVGKAGEVGTAHDRFRRVAEEHGVSPQRVTLAWMLAKSPVVIPIPGASRPETIRDSAAAPDLTLTEEQFALLDQD